MRSDVVDLRGAPSLWSTLERELEAPEPVVIADRPAVLLVESGRTKLHRATLLDDDAKRATPGAEGGRARLPLDDDELARVMLDAEED